VNLRVRVENAWARHRAAANSGYCLVFNTSARPCRIIAKYGRLGSKARYSVFPINHVVRRALFADSTFLFVCTFLGEVC